MANTKSAAKRARQTERRTIVSRRALSAVKNQLKKFRTVAAARIRRRRRLRRRPSSPSIDKAAKTGRVHRNAANRHKSKVNRALAKLA